MSIPAELQAMSAGNIVVLYELDLNPLGVNEILRFHPGVNALGADVVWNGNSYTRLPIEASGFEVTGTGTQARPKLAVANIDGLMGLLARSYGGLEGAALTRIRTFLKFLDGENFPDRKNLLTRTDAATGTGWTLLRSLTSPAQITNPDGGPSATLWVESTTAGISEIGRSAQVFEDGKTYCYSVHVKQHTNQALRLQFPAASGFATDHFAVFDPSTGSVLSQSGVGSSATITPVQGRPGWYRASIAATCTSSTNAAWAPMRLHLDNASNDSGLYVWGAQLEEGDKPTSYEPVLDTFLRNPTADPTQVIEQHTYYVSRKSNENRIFVEYELASAFDLTGLRIPARQIIQNCCTWLYRSPECSYAGPPVADVDDVPTNNPALDSCGLRIQSCKLRFGANNTLPFGGFPGAGLIR